MSGPTLFDADVSERERFLRFDQANPDVCAALRRLALHAKDRGVSVGIRLLWERLRWELNVEVRRPEGDFHLNNNLTRWYARALMEREPALRGYFETRGDR